MSSRSLLGELWVPVPDGDDRARALYLRHYSARQYRDRRPRRKFAGPGRYLVLLTPDGRALFIWRKFRPLDRQEGVSCAVFHNEGPHRSSDLILQAEEYAWKRWPGERLYTYVNPRRVRSPNPGYCFLAAGWQRCGRTRGGLVVLEKLPQDRTGERPV